MKPQARSLQAFGLTTLVAALAACGGGGSGGVTSTVNNLSGRIVDGYIGGATVCLDLNSNLACDPGEPQTISAVDGSYTLPTYNGSIDGLQVIAVVPVGATDSDLGVITKAFDLIAPAESASMVTPLTTLVANDMTTRKVSAAEAEKAVIANFNLPSATLLGVDPVAKGGEILKVAQVVTAAIASTKENLVELNKTGSLGLDTAAIVKAAITEVKASVLPQVLSTDGKVAIDTTGKKQGEIVALVAQAADVKGQLTGKVQQVVAKSKLGEGTVLSMADAFRKGIAISQIDSGDYLDSKGKRIGNYSGFSDKLVVEYFRYDVDKDIPPTETTKVWLNGVEGQKWYTRYDDDATEVRYFFDGTQWQKAVGSFFSAIPTVAENCMTVPVVKGSAIGQKICGVARDLSGMKMADFMKNEKGESQVCRDTEGKTIADCDPNQTFPSGSVAYDLTISVSQNLYEIWTGSNDWIGYAYQGINWNNPLASTPTIEKFIAKLKNGPQWTGSNCSIGFRVKSVATDGKSGVMEFGENVANACKDSKVERYVETTTFTVEKVGDRDVLRMFYPNLYRKLNPGDANNGEAIFTVVKKDVTLNGTKMTIDGIFNGEFQKASQSTSIPFTGNLGAGVQVTNPTLLEAALKARGIKTNPY